MEGDIAEDIQSSLNSIIEIFDGYDNIYKPKITVSYVDRDTNNITIMCYKQDVVHNSRSGPHIEAVKYKEYEIIKK